MGSYQSVTITSPYGAGSEVLKINSDGESYILRDVIGRAGDYTFSVWHKGEGMTISLFGDLGHMPQATEWEKYVQTVTITDLTDDSIYILPDSNADAFLFEAYCAEGVIDTSWSPNPDDQKEINALVETSITNLSGRATSIEGDLTTLNDAVSMYQSYMDIQPSVPSITLGKTSDGSSFRSKVVITATAVEFHVDDKPLAYASGQAFNAPEGIFTNVTMRTYDSNGTAVGNLRWIARANGHLSLKVVK